MDLGVGCGGWTGLQVVARLWVVLGEGRSVELKARVWRRQVVGYCRKHCAFELSLAWPLSWIVEGEFQRRFVEESWQAFEVSWTARTPVYLVHFGQAGGP